MIDSYLYLATPKINRLNHQNLYIKKILSFPPLQGDAEFYYVCTFGLELFTQWDEIPARVTRQAVLTDGNQKGTKWRCLASKKC